MLYYDVLYVYVYVMLCLIDVKKEREERREKRETIEEVDSHTAQRA